MGGRGPPWLRIEHEDGSSETLRLHGQNCRDMAFTAVDGRACRTWLASLPPQPIGRHRILREDQPDLACDLTIAPPRCHLPRDLAGGGRRFGIAAHLYSLRRAGDQGIGDFTTLRRLAELSAAQGAAMLGLNPLHALFGGARDRASPYHPSDRRFLDPIYIDVGALDDLPPVAATSSDEAMAALRAQASVDYPGVWALQAKLLH